MRRMSLVCRVSMLAAVFATANGCSDDETVGSGPTSATTTTGVGGSGASGGSGGGGAAGGAGGEMVVPVSPVTGLDAVYDATAFDVTLTWTNPTEPAFAGLLVARSVGGNVGTPEAGSTYMAGATLPGGGDVLFVGDTTPTMHVDASPLLGATEYAVFAIDEAGNYTAPALATVDVTEPEDIVGTISVDLATGAVTVIDDPHLLSLGGTATYDAVNDVLTVSLDVTNDYNRMLFNLKAVVTATNDGVVTGDGLYQNDPYVYYGPEGQLEAATITRDIVVDVVDGATDPVTLDLSFENHAMLFAPGQTGGNPIAVDSSGVGQEFQLDLGSTSYSGTGGSEKGGARPGVWSADGRMVYLGSRSQPTVVTIDTSTMMASLTADLTGANNLQNDTTGSIGSVDYVLASPDGVFLYALLTEELHQYGNRGDFGTVMPSSISIVKIDRATLAEVARAEIVTDDGNFPEGKGLALSPDGSMIACGVRVRGEVYVADTATLTVVDADSSTVGIQPFNVSGHGTEPRRVAFSADGSKLFVAQAGQGPDGSLDVIDLGTLAITVVDQPASWVGIDPYQGAFERGPAGRIYVGRPYYESTPDVPGLAIYDPLLDTWTELFENTEYVSVNAMMFAPDGLTYWLYHNPGGSPDFIQQYTVANNTVVPMEADGADRYDIAINGWGHTFLISPF